MSKLETNTIDTVSGTSTLQVGSTNTSTITLGVSGDTINVPSGVTIANSGTATGFGGANTPAFHAYKSSSDNSVTDNTYVKVTLESELLDSDGAWDVSTSKFTPQVAGKYLIMGAVYLYAGSTGTLRNSYTLIYKNGSEVGYARNNFQANDISASHVTFQAVVDMNGSTDYVELYGAIDVTSGTPYFGQGSKSTYMSGFKIIE